MTDPKRMTLGAASVRLRIWDAIVSDLALVRRLSAVHEEFRLVNKSTFHWYARTGNGRPSPRNPIEELAEVVIVIVAPERLAGVEYWTNTLIEGESMHLHQDKDERLYFSRKHFAHPLYSTVYYPGHSPFEGGELIVDGSLLKLQGNQLVAFRGSLPHGVNKVRNGVRHSIALNLWDHTPGAYKTFEA